MVMTMNKRKDQTVYVEISHLSKTYDISEPFYARLLTGKKKVMLHAVNDVSFQIMVRLMPWLVKVGLGNQLWRDLW